MRTSCRTVLGVASAVVFVAMAAAGCGTSTNAAPVTSSPATYGGLPTWLPTPTHAVDQVLTGTTAKPALTEQGLFVKAELSTGGSVLITVAGPTVPGEGLPQQNPTTTCTWTVTMKDATVAVPVSADDFRARDGSGTVYAPIMAPNQPTPPTSVTPGKTVSFQLRATMPTGEAIMQWAPDAKNPLATWDFVIEND